MNDKDGTYYDVCATTKLEYYLHGLENLGQLLQVVGEIAAETGMQEWVMTHHGHRLRYCWPDAKMVVAGAMSEDDYIARNGIILTGE